MRGRPAWLGFAALAAACVLLPLWPLVVGPGFHGPDRYLYLLWWVAAAGLVAALRGAAARLPLAPAGRDAVASRDPQADVVDAVHVHVGSHGAVARADDAELERIVDRAVNAARQDVGLGRVVDRA